jgi:diacylglycerol kinase (ATP)
MEKKKIVFVINPVSGGATKGNFEKIINESIDKQKYFHSIEYTKGPGHATEICFTHVENGTDVIVAVGGDGSVNEIAKGIAGTQTTLGILPAGSGNGLAHHLKIPRQIKEAIEIINKGKVIRMDTGLINDKLFVSIAGIGFDGLVARKFAESRRRGFLTYLRIVTEEYPKYRPRKYTLNFNGSEIKTKALFITFANSDQFGYRTSIAPGAQVDDGLLNITIMKKPLMIEVPFLASLLYWRKIDMSKHIEIYKTNELTVKSRRKRWVNIDGEPVKMKKKLKIILNPQTLNVIVP